MEQLLRKRIIRTLREWRSAEPEKSSELIRFLENATAKDIVERGLDWDMFIPEPIYDPVTYVLLSMDQCLYFIFNRPPPKILNLDDCIELPLEALSFYSDGQIFQATGFWTPTASRADWLNMLKNCCKVSKFFIPRFPDSKNILDPHVEDNCACGETETLLGRPILPGMKVYSFGTLTNCRVFSSEEVQNLLTSQRRFHSFENPSTRLPFNPQDIKQLKDLAIILDDEPILKILAKRT